MPSVSIRNLPDEVHRALRVRAAQHGRSIEAEMRAGVALLPVGKRRNSLHDYLEKRVLPAFVGRVLPFDVACTSAYAQVLATARKAGRGIDTVDAWIAAVAAANGLTVATRDTSPFLAAGEGHLRRSLQADSGCIRPSKCYKRPHMDTSPRPLPLSPEAAAALLMIGRDIRDARLARRLRHQDLAARAGISVRTLRRLEGGDPTIALGRFLEVLTALSPALTENVVQAVKADPTGDALRRRAMGSRSRREAF